MGTRNGFVVAVEHGNRERSSEYVDGGMLGEREVEGEMGRTDAKIVEESMLWHAASRPRRHLLFLVEWRFQASPPTRFYREEQRFLFPAAAAAPLDN